MTNTKKKHGNKMKLLSAVGMLTVSAAMLVSSTFAWFSMNKQVTAQTMSIQAKSADPIIEISANGTNFYNNLASSGEGSNWTLPATTTGTGESATPVKLKLVTPTAIAATGNTKGTVDWGWAASSNHANAEVTNDTTAKALTAQSTPAKTESDRAAYLGDGTDLYVLTQKLTIRNVSPDVIGNNLKIDDVTLNGGTNSIKAAARLLFVSDGKYALYDGTGALIAEGNHQWLKSENSTAMTVSSGKPIIASTIAANKTQEIDVDVYFFFDGTDTDAFTDNATDLSTVTAQFTFGID